MQDVYVYIYIYADNRTMPQVLNKGVYYERVWNYTTAL